MFDSQRGTEGIPLCGKWGGRWSFRIFVILSPLRMSGFYFEEEAPECQTNSLCQQHRRCKENSAENMKADIRVQGVMCLCVRTRPFQNYRKSHKSLNNKVSVTKIVQLAQR